MVSDIKSLDQFREIIDSGKPVVIDFWAEWCGPCKVISPEFERFASLPENEGVSFYKVDVDASQEIAQEVGIRAMPTFMLFKDGEKVETVVGANPPNLQGLVLKAASLA